MVVCSKAARLKKKKKNFSQMESGNMVPFTVAVGMWCVYLEPTQVYIAQDKPNKAHTTILEKDPTKRVANKDFEQLI